MSYVQYTIKHKPLLWIVMWLSGWRWGIWAEKKVPMTELNPRLKQIRKVQHHNLPNITYERQQVPSTGAIYVVFLRLHMRSATGSAAGSWTCVPYCRWEVIHYIYFCKKICLRSAFQQSDDASKYRCPFKRPCQIFFFPGSGPPPNPQFGIPVPPPPWLWAALQEEWGGLIRAILTCSMRASPTECMMYWR